MIATWSQQCTDMIFYRQRNDAIRAKAQEAAVGELTELLSPGIADSLRVAIGAVTSVLKSNPELVIAEVVEALTPAQRAELIASPRSSDSAIVKAARKHARALAKASTGCGCSGHGSGCACCGPACGCAPFPGSSKFRRRKGDGAVVSKAWCADGKCQVAPGFVLPPSDDAADDVLADGGQVAKGKYPGTITKTYAQWH
jgi:hypothetical protein